MQNLISFEMAGISEDQEYEIEDVRLIQAVRIRPLLWDVREQEYRNKNRKNVVWQQIGDELQLTAGKIFLRYTTLT